MDNAFKISVSSKRAGLGIVTPSFNQGPYVRETIASVLMQGLPVDYVVMDGGSTDETVEVLEQVKFEGFSYVSEPDDGQAAAIKSGFGRVSGEILCYLNSDDYLMPGALDYVLDYFEKNPSVDAIYSHRLFIGEFGDVDRFWVLPAHSNFLMSRWDYIPQETCFWRRSLMEAAGGIDADFRFAMDYDLFTRMMLLGKFKRVNKFLAVFREHDESKTSRLVLTVGQEEIDRVRARRGIKIRLIDRVLGTLFGQTILKSSWLYLKLIYPLMRRNIEKHIAMVRHAAAQL